MKEHGIDAIPFKHEKMDEWRDALRRGATYHFPNTNLLITGVLIALSVRWAWQRGYSPLEIFSKRADTVFVETLHRRVPLKGVV